MAATPTQADYAPDLAAQEAARLELARQRRPVALPNRIDRADENPFAESAPEVDQAISRQSREQSFASRLSKEHVRERARERDQSLMPSSGMSMRDAVALAKGGPTGLAFQAIAGGGGTGPGGMPMNADQVKKMIGHGLIKMSWANLWLTFGHSIYFIFILFFSGWASTYLRQYIPEVGMEWFPGDIASKIPKHMFLPLKLGEIIAISFIMFWVILFDLIILGCLGVVLGIVMDAARVTGII